MCLSGGNAKTILLIARDVPPLEHNQELVDDSFIRLYEILPISQMVSSNQHKRALCGNPDEVMVITSKPHEEAGGNRTGREAGRATGWHN